MIKILYFVDRLLWGGIQSLCYDIIQNADPDKIKIELLTLDDGKNYDLEQTLISKGIKIHKLEGIWVNNLLDYIAYIKSIKQFFNENNDYQAVHMNSSSKNFYILYAAKQAGIPVRIAHAHNTDFQTKNKLKKAIGASLNYFLKKYASDYLACSKIAGEWMFGQKNVENGKVVVINNGIAASDFVFKQNWRDELRAELNIENKFVIGCVGRFAPQKNHRFLLEVFAEIKKKKGQISLLLIGEGALQSELEQQAKALKIENDIHFLGFRTDRNRWLSAMDNFVLTSTFEGLGIVLIEAQAAGLPTFAPVGVIPDEANISPLLDFIPLTETPQFWADKIIKTGIIQRVNMLHCIQESGYDIKQVVKKLESIYSRKE